MYPVRKYVDPLDYLEHLIFVLSTSKKDTMLLCYMVRILLIPHRCLESETLRSSFGSNNLN